MADMKKYHDSITTPTGKKVVDILSVYPGCKMDKTAIGTETDVTEDLHYTNKDVLEIIFELESAFGVDIPDREVDKIRRTVGDLIDYMNTL